MEWCEKQPTGDYHSLQELAEELGPQISNMDYWVAYRKRLYDSDKFGFYGGICRHL